MFLKVNERGGKDALAMIEVPVLTLFQSTQFSSVLEKLNSGVRRVLEVDSKVLPWRTRGYAGLVSIPSLRVLCQSGRAWNSLTPAARHFVNRHSTVQMVFSALPLLCRYWGLKVTCWKFHCSTNFANSDEAKHDPLSATNVPRTPNWLKVPIRLLITDLEVSDGRESTSMKLLK